MSVCPHCGLERPARCERCQMNVDLLKEQGAMMDKKQRAKEWLNEIFGHDQWPEEVYKLVEKRLTAFEREMRLDEATWWADGNHAAKYEDSGCESENCRKCKRLAALSAKGGNADGR